MSACKFHPFEKLTDETSYFADSITAMTDEDKEKMYKKFAKTNLGQAANQQKNKMDETRTLYSSVANAKKSFENGETAGLGWIDADVVKFDFSDNENNLKVPHVGWNSVMYKNNCSLFDEIPNDSDFYFVHSYHYKIYEDISTGETRHGEMFTSSIQKNNIYGFQFHPEKSQSAGLKIINNFINL